MKSFIVLLIVLVLFKIDNVVGDEPSPNVGTGNHRLVFSTWEGFEVDKCASIWLIKRFIDEDAVIRFFPKSEVLDEGIPFDTPDAKLRRYHNMSTFECILKHYKVKNTKLVYMGRIIHDIEVNIWERKVLNETPVVKDAILRIITESESNDEIIKKSCKYFDLLFERIRR